MKRIAINELHENPNNRRNLEKKDYQRLIAQMRMGDHSIFLISPENMVIDGNHRLKAAKELGWEQVGAKELSFEKDDQAGYYALIDNEVVRNESGIIPYYYASIDAGQTAYALSRNGNVAYYNDQLLDDMPQLELDWEIFPLDITPPKDINEIINAHEEKEKKKLYQVIIDCQNLEDLEEKYNQIVTLGIAAKKKG